MEAKEIRNKLKKCQPYLIQRDLLPKLFFKEEDNDLLDEYGNKKETEYWIFFYAFIRKLTDLAIGVRLGYTPQNINKRTIKIIKNNYSLIETFLSSQIVVK